MAHLHFRRTVYKSGGRKAASRVAYIARQQTLDRDAEHQLRYIQRADREDLVYTQSRNLPAWAAGSAQTYFRTAEQYEWALGNAFEEWKITLPQELSHRHNMDLMRDLVESIAGDRLPITYAFHCPATMDGTQAQPHLHLLLSGRQEDGIARTPAHHFKKYNRTHPERGGAPKDPALYHVRAVKAWRVTIADVINLHLERAGCEARIHPDRLEDRELTRTPEPKLFPSESEGYREKGLVSETMAEVLAIRAERQHTRPAEQANAQAYWAQRKEVLGLTDAMDAPAQLAAVCAARTQVREQAPARTVAQGYAGVEPDERALGDLAREAYVQAQAEVQALWGDAQDEQTLRGLGREVADDAWRDAVLLWAEEQGARALRDVGWDAVQMAWEDGQTGLAAQVSAQRMQEQSRAWSSLEQDLHALVQQLDALSETEGSTGHVRIRLHDREREQGLGL